MSSLLTYGETEDMNVSANVSDLYEYVYGDLIVYCHFEKYDQITGLSYVVICCFSLLGNSLLLYCLTRFEDLKRVTMRFLFFLALFDSLFTLTIPFWAVENLKEWIFGDAACKILTGAYFIGIYGSLILLTAMTVDCFFFIVVRSQWLTRRRRLKCATAAFAGSWLISVFACLKDALSSEVKIVNFVQTCDTTASQHDHAGYFTQLVMLFGVPLVIIIVCYSKILHTLMSSTGRTRYKTFLVVLLIIIAFVICWGPYHIIIILLSMSTDKDCEKSNQLHQTFVACRILAYSHCCINPLLYLIRGRSRKILANFLFCQTQHRSAQASERSSDPSHFIQPHLSMAVPQNVTELKFL
ncbi:C-C chemokine receptor type 3 [Bagarius yarrelli]|uniref:C-C chemokine receptor type 3 n=1 Tax=Bagarius yarrelli TaxID=175774 RepID=A0A556VA24_BAGYA|nr:C-C chemokine receptor type 3 [Bagarius yarrelli]